MPIGLHGRRWAVCRRGAPRSGLTSQALALLVGHCGVQGATRVAQQCCRAAADFRASLLRCCCINNRLHGRLQGVPQGPRLLQRRPVHRGRVAWRAGVRVPHQVDGRHLQGARGDVLQRHQPLRPALHERRLLRVRRRCTRVLLQVSAGRLAACWPAAARAPRAAAGVRPHNLLLTLARAAAVTVRRCPPNVRGRHCQFGVR